MHNSIRRVHHSYARGGARGETETGTKRLLTVGENGSRPSRRLASFRRSDAEAFFPFWRHSQQNIATLSRSQASLSHHDHPPATQPHLLRRLHRPRGRDEGARRDLRQMQPGKVTRLAFAFANIDRIRNATQFFPRSRDAETDPQSVISTRRLCSSASARGASSPRSLF